MTNQQLEAAAELAKRSFAFFVQFFWSAIDKSEYSHQPYISIVCQHLQAVADGKIKRLICNQPRRHLKTTLFCIAFPAFRWITNPKEKFIVSSYAMGLATDSTLKCRTLIESPLFQECYGEKFKLREDQNQKSRFYNDAGGQVIACSPGSVALGLGGNTVLADDLNNIAEQSSDASKNEVINFYNDVLANCLDNPSTGSIIVVQQRCGQGDLTDHLLKAGGKWEHLCLPFEKDERTSKTSIWQDTRNIGERLSDRLTDENIAEKKLNPSVWETQYQQKGISSVGNMFNRADFRYYDYHPTDFNLDGKVFSKDDTYTIATVDLAISTKTTADYTVIQVWSITPDGELVLLNQHRNKHSAKETLELIRSVYDAYDLMYVGIEDVAFQRMMVQFAADLSMRVKSLKPKCLDKKTRALALQVMFGAHKVYFPRNAPYLADLESELLSFYDPNSHNDMVDCAVFAALEVGKPHRIPKVKPPDDTPEQIEEKMRKDWCRAMLAD